VCGGSLGAIPIMPRSVKPVIPYSTAMLCASICGALGIDIGQTSVAKYFGQMTKTTVARLEDVPAQSR
jgi:hypothetical protein